MKPNIFVNTQFCFSTYIIRKINIARKILKCQKKKKRLTWCMYYAAVVVLKQRYLTANCDN